MGIKDNGGDCLLQFIHTEGLPTHLRRGELTGDVTLVWEKVGRRSRQDADVNGAGGAFIPYGP